MQVKAIRDFRYKGNVVKKGKLIELEGETLKNATNKGVVALEVTKEVEIKNIEKEEVKNDGFPCPYCDFVGKTEAGLKRHISTKHKDEVKDVEVVEEEENTRPRSNS